MGAARGLVHFAAGFGKGYMDQQEKERQRKIEEDRLDIEKRRAELEAKRLEMDNGKLQREEEMHQQLARVNQEVKPVQMFVVNTPQGPMYQASEDLAKAQAAELGTQVQPVFVVGTSTFADKQAAADAADSMNLPAVQMRRRAEVYQRYGREDLANATMQNYKLTLDNNRREIQEAYIEAAQKGPDAVMKLYNQNVKDGNHFQLTPDGTQLQVTRGGQVVNTVPWNEQTAAQFMDMAYKRAMVTPDNMAEVWYKDKTLGLQDRQVGVQEKVGASQVKLNDAHAADVPLAAQDRRTQAQASATSAGAAATQAQTGQFNAITARGQVTAPVVSSAPDAKGGLNIVMTPRPAFDAKTGTWGQAPAGASTIVPLPGLKDPRAYGADARNQIPGMGPSGAPAGVQIDWNAAAQTLSSLPAKGQPTPTVPTGLGGVPGSYSTTPQVPATGFMTEEQRRLYAPR